MRLACLLITALLTSPALAESSVVLLHKPLVVTVAFVDPQSRGNCEVVPLSFTIRSGAQTETVNSAPVLCLDEPIATRARKHLVWRPPYLLVQSHCGGGNAWNCESRVLFSYRKGTLTRLGTINDLLFLSKATYFLKTYSALEDNELIHHTGRPFRIVLRDEGFNLAFDADLTWVLNHEQYDRFDRYELDCGPQKHPCDHSTKVAAIFNASLAKLTNRPHYVESVTSRMKERLSPAEYDIFVRMLQTVTPAQIPDSLRGM